LLYRLYAVGSYYTMYGIIHYVFEVTTEPESENLVDRQTEEQTDRRKNRQTPHDSIDRACIASRGKNTSQHVPVYLQQFPSYSNHNYK